MTCSKCYPLPVKSCSTEYVLVAGLTALTAYYWVLISKFGKRYQKQVETDAEGNLPIDLTALPAGATNPHAGPYELQIREGANFLNVVDLTFEEDTYTCAYVNFEEVEDLTEVEEP